MPVDSISRDLLRWYDGNARALPWRHPPGCPETPDPYRVWLAEIMLQQTTVAAAGPYWLGFLARWPTVRTLAQAEDSEVMREWAGLGYYARARNLLAAARAVAASGAFPSTESALRQLPGVGAYTAAAIAAIAFGETATVVDANIERVVSRLFAIATPLPSAKPQITATLTPHVPTDRPGDFAQALMDLGATICTPRSPHCLACPLRQHCTAHAAGNPEAYPVKFAKRPRPTRQGMAWWIEQGGAVALIRRPPRGLLGGMPALPGTGWAVNQPFHLPFEADWRILPEPVSHGFTHFELRLSLACATVPQRLDQIDGHPIDWTSRRDIATIGLPTLYVRAAQAALRHSLEQASA